MVLYVTIWSGHEGSGRLTEENLGETRFDVVLENIQRLAQHGTHQLDGENVANVLAGRVAGAYFDVVLFGTCWSVKVAWIDQCVLDRADPVNKLAHEDWLYCY